MSNEVIPLAKGGIMKALILSRPMKVLLFAILALVLTTSLANAWGNYQQESGGDQFLTYPTCQRGSGGP
jgi:hypothetical protein